MLYKLVVLAERHSESYYELIEKNRSRLLRYFPITCKQIHSVESARKQLLSNEIEGKEGKEWKFGIMDKEKVIGYIHVKNFNMEVSKCELGYFIDSDYEGKGITSYFIDETVRFCFEELSLLKVFLRIASENVASQKIAIKVGFQREGILRKEFKLKDGSLVDVEYWGILSIQA